MVSRFIFLFALVKWLKPAEVGSYGLLVAAVSYSIYLVGLDFYTYTTRQISGGERMNWGWYIKCQVTLSALLYSITFPFLILIFLFGWLPWDLAGWFFIVLVLEYFCLEAIRFFIAASEQISASIVLFLNQAFWAVAAVIFMATHDGYQQLNYVLFAWCMGSVAALVYSFFKIKSMCLGGWSDAVDFRWIWTGIKVAVPLLIATLAFRGIFTFDRYLIKEFLSLEIVAVYVFFIGVAGTLLAFLDAAVFSFAYPSMINAYKNKDANLFKKNMKIMFFSVIALSVVFALSSLFVFPYMLVWIGKAAYSDSYFVFYWVLLAMIINSFWMIFHYALYAQQHDRQIIYSHVSAFFIFLIVSYCVHFYYPNESVLVGLCISQFLILAWKVSAYRYLTPTAFLGFGLK